jgi:hypothetical protein
MYKPPIIGFTGPPGAGKSLCAEVYRGVNGGYLYAFATPIKNMLRAGFGIDFEDPYWNDRDNKEKLIPAFGVSPRELMQTLGSNWGRELVNPDVWITLATGVLIKRGAGMVISDLRFENEAKWVRDRGGIVVHVSTDKPFDNGHYAEKGIKFKKGDYKFDGSQPVNTVYDRIVVLCQKIAEDHEQKTGDSVHRKRKQVSKRKGSSGKDEQSV